jgi:signal transduction histidine kinase
MARRIATLEAQRELARMQDEFVSTVSHELRTPLGFIKGYTTTLLRNDAEWDSAARLEFLKIIDEEADRLRELIDNLLDSSRLESGTLSMTLEPVRLSTLLRDTVSRAQALYPGMPLRIDVPDQLPIMQVDATRLSQVLDNLLSNADKYAQGAEVTVSARVEGPAVVVRVRDLGPGIPPQHQSRLFERFFRVPGAKSMIRGTGLCLYICRKIVEAHGGEILVEGVAGGGTCFAFSLPLEPLEAPA